MKKLPDALFVVDPKEDYNAVLEARKLNIPVFGIADTNCDPAILDYAIPGNDDAVKAIKLLVGVMNDAIVEAKGGLLEFAYTTDEVTMSDVIIAVQEQAAENERRRKSKNEERRQQNNRQNHRKFEKKEKPVVTQETTTETPVETKTSEE